MDNIYVIFDTSVATENIGDYIIMDAVKENLDKLAYSVQSVTMPTHDTLGPASRYILKRSKFAIVGGTNLLTSHMLSYRQWKFSLKDIYYLNNVILMGVGWWQYQSNPDFISSFIYRKILSRDVIHSVRDAYTEEKLKSVGISNVINTGCATMWGLNHEHCKSIPVDKANSVVFTLTDYRPNSDRDSRLIKRLSELYNDVYYWPQGVGDVNYFEKINSNNKIIVLSPNLNSFNDVLVSGDIDYVGNRLHAGVRALQKKVRTLIVAIDNRANEKSKDFNIPVISVDEIDNIKNYVGKSYETKILIPEDKILKWKSQFNGGDLK